MGIIIYNLRKVAEKGVGLCVCVCVCVEEKEGNALIKRYEN